MIRRLVWGACAWFALAAPLAHADWLQTGEGCRVFMIKPPKKAEASWTGPCAGGTANGKGVFRMTTEREDGKHTSTITGKMQDGRFVGTVRIDPGNGDLLEGALEDGRMRAAKITFADGRAYTGPIVNGLPNGKGKMNYPDGMRYEGDMRNGVRQGQGIAVYENGARYAGAWRFDLRHGKGDYTTPKGMVISGTFKNDELRGRARFTGPDGAWFEGPTKKQNPHGKGMCGGPERKAAVPCEFRKGKFRR